jgi:dipeptidyl aminopeptidase/acylaminoacyl peptidase
MTKLICKLFIIGILLFQVINIYPVEKEIIQLTFGEQMDYWPQWSPDSKKIVFYVNDNGNRDIWLMDADGNNLKKITNDPSQNLEPTWSIDGSKIYFSSNRDGNYDIYVMKDLNFPENVEKLTDSPADERWPRVSPTKFAQYNPCNVNRKFRNYHKGFHHKITYSSNEGEENNIWIMHESGTHKMRLTDGLGDCSHPSWARNSKSIFFDVKKENKTKIMKVSPPKLYIPENFLKKLANGYPVNCSKEIIPRGEFGGGIKNLKIQTTSYNFESNCSHPSVSANGNKVLLLSEYTGNKDVLILDMSNNKVKNITDYKGTDYCAAWSPNGRHIAFTSFRADNKSHIFAMKMDDFPNDILNFADYKFSNEQIELLKKANFFVSKDIKNKQFFHTYEKADYKYRPVFITTDSILHLFHVFFDYSLWKIEKDYLYDDLVILTNELLKCSLKDYQDSINLREEALSNLVFFGVAAKIIGIEIELPSEVKDLIELELYLVNGHNIILKSPYFKKTIDYTQFVVRGHYTDNEILQKYFKAMMWYAKTNFSLSQGTGAQNSSTLFHDIKRMLLIYSYLHDKVEDDRTIFEIWNRIYEPATFFVGSAEDICLYDIEKIAQNNYDNSITKEMINDQQVLSVIHNELLKLPAPEIAPLEGKSFRFMPQRFVPDAKIIQDMVFDMIKPDVGTFEKPRLMAKGLDVMGVLGSDRAYEILDTLYCETNFYNYSTQFNKLRAEFNRIEETTWKSNLYWGWLQILKSLVTQDHINVPEFMNNIYWKDKELLTALASWTELKHDTILYSKQPFAAECSAPDMEEPIPNILKAYVEPNIELYQNLALLVKKSRDGLEERKLLDNDELGTFKKLESLITFLGDIAQKELEHLPITDDEIKRIQKFGGEIEHLTLSLTEGEYRNLYNDDMALVADVLTSLSIKDGKLSVLEEGVGRAHSIFVLLEIDNYRQINEGAVFSYYEFVWPASNRLTDKEWRKLLDSPDAPEMPEWTNSFIK